MRASPRCAVPVCRGVASHSAGDSEAAAATVDVVDVPPHVAAVARLRQMHRGYLT